MRKRDYPKRRPDPKLSERKIRDNGLGRFSANPNSTAYAAEVAEARKTMVEIAPDEYRTCARRELRRRKPDPHRRQLLLVIMSKVRQGEQPEHGKPYTRKAKAQRKGIAARRRVMEIFEEGFAMNRLVHRARGQVGGYPMPTGW